MYTKGTIIHHHRPVQRILHLTIKLEDNILPSPGQFIMLWVPSVGEIPLSISDYSADSSLLELIIAKVGRVTSYIHENFRKGVKVAIRGPYGRGFSLVKSSKCLIIAGGSGLAPFPFLIRSLRNFNNVVDVLIGFKTKTEVFHLEKFQRLARKVWIATDDGSYGLSGLIPEILEKGIVELEEYDIVYSCGKEPMIAKVVRLCHDKGVQCQVSLERLIKCGIGICGACVLDDEGLRVCRDGPVFDGDILLSLEDFARYWRDHDGRKIRHPHC